MNHSIQSRPFNHYIPPFALIICFFGIWYYSGYRNKADIYNQIGEILFPESIESISLVYIGKRK